MENYKNYIIVFSEVDFDQEEFVKFIDNNTNFTFWFTFVRNSVFIKTVLNSRQIYEIIKESYPKKKVFITKIDKSDASGFIPKKYMQYLR